MQILVLKVDTQKVLEFYMLSVNIYHLLKNSGYAFKSDHITLITSGCLIKGIFI